MLYEKKNRREAEYLEPIFGTRDEDEMLPSYKLGEQSMEPRVAYQMIKDDLLDEGKSRLNLATFCQTYLEPEAVKLMSETLDRNAIDKSEYPRTAEIENRCVNIIADLWHGQEDFIGTSTIGSSEACMLAGMAMKFSWRKRAAKLGVALEKRKPNLIISSGYQVCWEKFCVYWDIELREIPLTADCLSLDIEKAMAEIDEYTIGVVGILGITYTGQYDDIEKLDAKLTEYNKQTEHKVYIHVDAASGGLYAPFVEPDLKWDFQLENVISINASGHKYGLVYPGVGWVVWKNRSFLPEELIFKVSYLGGELPTMAINFSHSAAQLIGQYYNFVRFGFNGYQSIHKRTHDVAMYLAEKLKESHQFELINDGKQLPLVCYQLHPDEKRQWTLYDLSDRLLMKGWQVPTYPLPKSLDNQVIQRIVVRSDFGMNMAHDFIEDLKAAITELEQSHLVFHEKTERKNYGFTH